MIEYPVSNHNNWELLWNATLTAPSIPIETDAAKKAYPIPVTTMPVLTESPIVLIYAYSTTAKGTWHYAGLVKQKVNLGVTVGTNNHGVVSAKKIYLNQFSILRYPINYDMYALEFSIPYWIRSITIQVWQFIGTEINSIETGIEEIKTALGVT